MKVVSCKKCGAKYQLDDDNNIEEYECSACMGSLELLESYPLNSSPNNKIANYNSLKDNSDLVYCSECGLKHVFDQQYNITEYKCSSCYGDLRYLTDKNNINTSIKDVNDDIGNVINNDSNNSVNMDDITSNPVNMDNVVNDTDIANGSIDTDYDSSYFQASEDSSINNGKLVLNEEDKAEFLKEYLKKEFSNNIDENFNK